MLGRARSRSRDENHNQVDYGPLKVGIVSGNVIDGVNAPVIGACVLLFNEQNHELVIKTVADAKGRFRLANVAAGRYRLLIKVEGLCTANVPIVLGPTAEKKAITVHMKPRGVDDCSYGELR